LWDQVSPRQHVEAVLLDAYGQSPRPEAEPHHVDAMRRLAGIALDTVGGAPQKRCRPDRIAPLRMGEADSKLCQAAPQFALASGGCLPRTLQHLMCLERTADVEEPLRFGERLIRGQCEVVGHALDPRRAMRKGSAQLVTWAGVARASRDIPVPPTVTRRTHRFDPGLASHRRARSPSTDTG
jgi:hypothetical protein